MLNNYVAALKLVLVHEGGYINHPKDPGGPTNKGVTQRVYDAFRERKGLPKQSVRKIEVEIQEIYFMQYWLPIRGNDLPDGVDYATFDFAVNSGVSRAAKYLQLIVGVEADGHIGELTLGAIRKGDPKQIAIRLCDKRLAFMKSLKKLWPTFGKGWTRRVLEVKNCVKKGTLT